MEIHLELETIANIAETVGALVVVLTLIYLTIQIRQSNALLRSQSRQSQLSNDQTSLLLAFEHADLLQKMNSKEPLTPDEQMQLSLVYLIDMRNREFEFFQYKDGLLDEEAWKSFREIILINHATRKGRAWWVSVGRDIFDPEFTASVDELLQDAPLDGRMDGLASWETPGSMAGDEETDRHRPEASA